MPRRPDGVRPPWKGRRVLLGVTGGIAAYKSIQLARDLTRLGAEVPVVLTESATRFVTPLAFEAVTGGAVYRSLWSVEGAARHLQLARETDLVLIAPATADFIARSALGRADDLLTTILLASRAPVLLAPAMNDRMWSHPQTRRNADHLTEILGYHLAGPTTGALAIGEGDGRGRMEEPEHLLLHAGRLLGISDAWAGRRVLITAGPTREPLDPVRYLGNRSSGRMGYALAEAAWLRGADVTLVTGPTSLPRPLGVRCIEVETAREMETAVRETLPGHDLQIFAAAVADFRPEESAPGKVKRAGVEAGKSWDVSLVENPDVSADTRDARGDGSVTVGFALESEELIDRARGKMERKEFDFIVANPAGEEGAGFDSSTNRVTLLDRAGGVVDLPRAEKWEIAWQLLDRFEQGFASGGRDG
ncbi:MAG: bifunctional phosphopantothenoylcysteine decarboxylase/phosphopantothenate--cysteine ligase CoaBC [Gemmatimonadales bacterium]|nr:MAG: bifunctional phosphopantothenoylcysteine decarboxylase/phosphopantothenate--cysteine ligase CoaBC [Gemmatimonadales bacterium]